MSELKTGSWWNDSTMGWEDRTKPPPFGLKRLRARICYWLGHRTTDSPRTIIQFGTTCLRCGEVMLSAAELARRDRRRA